MSDVVTNEYGGTQSRIDARFDLVPPLSLQAAAEILGAGALKYGENNWQRITTAEHLNHVLNHINLHLIGDESENHLGNAMVRMMFAFHVEHNGVKIDSPSTKLKEAAERYKDFTNHQPTFDYETLFSTNDNTQYGH